MLFPPAPGEKGAQRRLLWWCWLADVTIKKHDVETLCCGDMHDTGESGDGDGCGVVPSQLLRQFIVVIVCVVFLFWWLIICSGQYRRPKGTGDTHAKPTKSCWDCLWGDGMLNNISGVIAVANNNNEMNFTTVFILDQSIGWDNFYSIIRWRQSSTKMDYTQNWLLFCFLGTVVGKTLFPYIRAYSYLYHLHVIWIDIWQYVASLPGYSVEWGLLYNEQRLHNCSSIWQS